LKRIFGTRRSSFVALSTHILIGGSWFGETQICDAQWRLRLSRVTHHVSRSFRSSSLSDATRFVASVMTVVERAKSGSDAQRPARA